MKFRELNTVKTSVLPISICKFNLVSVRISTQISVEQEKLNLNFYGKAEAKRNTDTLKKSQVEERLSWLVNLIIKVQSEADVP